jgi:hypothetical protein
LQSSRSVRRLRFALVAPFGPSAWRDVTRRRRLAVATWGVRRAAPLRLLLLGFVALYTAAFAVRAYTRNYQIFLPDYLFRWSTVGAQPLFAPRPTHIFLLVVDHFEPPNKNIARDWMRRYREMAARHRDSAGRPPQHTWFYREQISNQVLQDLATMTAAGLGEVELHHHHAYQTSETLRDALTVAIARFQQYGFLRTADGRTQFAFVHGNSGLDNSNGAAYCGVDTEIGLLRELGAFADFTFPSLYQPSQPKRVNSIYAARDDDAPKSYDRQLPLSALREGRADLMMFEGPLIFSPSLNVRHLFLDLDDGDVHATEHASPARAERWIRANVHVAERPDWVFVKLFSHGASTPGDVESVVGTDYEEMLSHLERRYNDGVRYVLHYVTAREAYNLARAAADGATGNPDNFMSAYAGPYAANVRVDALHLFESAAADSASPLQPR